MSDGTCETLCSFEDCDQYACITARTNRMGCHHYVGVFVGASRGISDNFTALYFQSPLQIAEMAVSNLNNFASQR